MGTMNNPWRQLSNKKPFILKEDLDLVNSFNRKTKNNKFKIRTDLLPDPYIGNPKAPIILLNLNPGIGGEEPKLHKKSFFIKACKANLLHNKQGFYYFKKEFKNTSGYNWWQKKLKGLLGIINEQKLGQNIFVIEYFPYHSKSFKAPNFLLPSQQYNKFLIQEALKRNDKPIIVLMRGKKLWLKLIPELRSYPLLYELRSTQAASLSRKNLGELVFRKILTKLDIQASYSFL